MSYTLDALADDIRRELSHGSPAAKEGVCRHVSRALTDREFVAAYLKDRPAGSDPREVLYEDPDLGFCICAHVYGTKAIGSPHDHGSSWAIYGQATGVTEMTEWKIVEKGEAEKPSLVEPVRTYLMHPGDVRHRGGAFAEAGSAGETDPNRGEEPRSRQAFQHQGEIGYGGDAKYAALLREIIAEFACAGRPWAANDLRSMSGGRLKSLPGGN